MAERPLILFTNDDGIASPGLWAAVEAFSDLGDLLVVAPREQQSGTARSLPVTSEGRIYEREMVIKGVTRTVYAVDGTPAQAVQHGVFELADRKPALCVSGINYGDNVGNGVTISGTVGAALEAASLGIPALAMSQQTPTDLHLSYSNDVDFTAAAHFARQFGEWAIFNRRPDDVDVLKIDVPRGATPATEWKITRVSRRRVYWPTRPERVALNDVGRMGYRFDADPSIAEPDSDVYVLLHEGKVSVTPLSLDLTARTDPYRLHQILTGAAQYANGTNGRHGTPADENVEKIAKQTRKKKSTAAAAGKA
ncbi:MAG: 5'/3'-nucleotidase SurE [bacterium]|nr:5'/3'-nucleotidase SurE [bacterium]